jgi:hypothetical protein
MRKIIGLLCFIGLTLTAPASAKVFHIIDNGGGNVDVFAAKWAQVSRDYERVAVLGRCQSACTQVLGIVPLSRICIGPNGYFRFHAASDDAHTARMAAHYPPVVRAWISKHNAIATREFTDLYAKDVTFLRKCPADDLRKVGGEGRDGD